jgi:hypothetical protein
MSAKKFSIVTLVALVCALVCLGAVTVVIDPLFHYHAPLDSLEYPITNERYQNDGILRNFTYDAIITGTSMTENFKASQFDDLFGVTSVKVPFSGSYFRERYDRLSRAFASNSNIRYVLFSLDSYAISAEKDMRNDYYEYPDYLYDNNLLNDVQYVFNKSILVEYALPVLEYTRSGQTTTDFDSYSNWMGEYTFGADSVLSKYSRPEKSDSVSTLSEEERIQIQENLEQNIISLAVEHPDTEFYVFFPPYSIVTWDERSQKGTLAKELERQQYTMELLLDYPNIHVFSFNDCFDIICDLDNYKDIKHYSEEINEELLVWMKAGEHEITAANLKQYLRTVEEFYTTYPYDDLFAS